MTTTATKQMPTATSRINGTTQISMLVQRAAINEPIHRLQPVYQYQKCSATATSSSVDPSAEHFLPQPRCQQKPNKNGSRTTISRNNISSSSPSSSSSSSSSNSPKASNSLQPQRPAQRELFSPGDYFAKQSMRSSQMAGKGKTWVRFRRENQPFGDLLLADQTNIVGFEIIERSIGLDNINQNDATDGILPI